MAFRKGYRAEIELIELLRQKGFFAVRIPISGSKNIPCDIMAARGDDRRVYQVKETKGSRIYLNEKQVEKLLSFAKAFGFKAYIAVRWKGVRGPKWSFIEVSEVKPLRVKRPSLM